MKNLPLFSQITPNEIKALTSLKNKEATENIFIFDKPFLTRSDVVTFIDTHSTITFNQFFDLFLKAQKEFEEDLDGNLDHVQAFFSLLNIKRGKSTLTAEAIENNPISVNLTFPVLINGDLTVSGWIGFHVLAEDEYLQLNGCWIEHNHLENSTKLWHFEDCEEDLIDTLKNIGIVDIPLPFTNEELFIFDIQSPFEVDGVFTEMLNKQSVRFLYQNFYEY